MERIITVNLTGVLKKPTSKRGRVAMDLLRKIVARSVKMPLESVVVDNSINAIVYRNMKNPIRRVKVKVVTDEKTVYIIPPEKELKKEKKEEKKAGIVEKIVGKKEQEKPAKVQEKQGMTEAKKEEEKPAAPQPKPKFEQKKMEAGK